MQKRQKLSAIYEMTAVHRPILRVPDGLPRRVNAAAVVAGKAIGIPGGQEGFSAARKQRLLSSGPAAITGPRACAGGP